MYLCIYEEEVYWLYSKSTITSSSYVQAHRITLGKAKVRRLIQALGNSICAESYLELTVGMTLHLSNLWSSANEKGVLLLLLFIIYEYLPRIASSVLCILLSMRVLPTLRNTYNGTYGN